MVEPVIRPGNPSDIPAVTELEREYMREYYPREEFSETKFQQQILEAMTGEKQMFYVSAEREELKGFVWAEERVEYGERMVYIRNLQVKPDYRRRGFARQLLEKAEETLKSRGIKTIQLHVLESNIPALTLYRSMGYYTVKRKLEKKLE